MCVCITSMWQRVKSLAGRFVMWAGRYFGVWVIRIVAWCVAAGYFLFERNRRRTSVAFYQAVFPGESRRFYLLCTWRQFQALSQSYCDEMAFSFGEPVNTTAEGREYIKEAVQSGKGGILLISHLGNWGVAARIFQRAGFKLMLIMGEREAKQVARQHREGLMGEGMKILISKPEDSDSLLTGIEALKFIREGGFLCLAGDITWSDPRSRLTVKFFNRDIYLPTGPHLLALVSGAPVFTMFNFRQPGGKYRFLILPPRYVKAPSRELRNDVIEKSAQLYASQLEEAVRRYPYEWHIFEPIFVNSKTEEK